MGGCWTSTERDRSLKPFGEPVRRNECGDDPSNPFDSRANRRDPDSFPVPNSPEEQTAVTRHLGRSIRTIVWIFLGTTVATAKAADGPGAPPVVGAKRAIAPAAPILPAEIVAAMQEGKYDLAVAGLNKLDADAKGPEIQSYIALIRGTAEKLAGKPQAARETWSSAIRNQPKGPWVAKIRFELAALELAAGRPIQAEALVRADTETLLAGDRKDRLAAVYHAFARRLLKPDDPITPPDPNGAYAMLVQARGLAKGQVLRTALLLEQARAAQAAGNHPQAIVVFQEYLKEPKALDRPAASYGLGESQFAAGQHPAARLTWVDLAAELAKPPASTRPDAAEIRAKALYRIAETHGIPNPPDDTQLNLGVAALKRFVTAYPSHPWAVKASFQIGLANLNRGKSEAGLAALRSFLAGEGYQAETEEAKRSFVELSMVATFQIGTTLQGQQKYDDAVDAFKAYLAKFPNGSHSAAAQRAILDTKLMSAGEAIRLRNFVAARAVWTEFVAQYPLDERIPQILFQIGESFVTAEKDDEAIVAWEPLLSKFPGDEPSSHAQFLIASIYEVQKGKHSNCACLFSCQQESDRQHQK